MTDDLLLFLLGFTCGSIGAWLAMCVLAERFARKVAKWVR